MLYFIDDEQVTIEEFMKSLEDDVYELVVETFDETLDDCYEPYQIGSCTYYASDILKNCDPVAYRCSISDEHSYKLEEYESYFEDEYEETINHTTYRTEEEPEEDDDDDYFNDELLTAMILNNVNTNNNNNN